jgi:hypothetical protein
LVPAEQHSVFLFVCRGLECLEEGAEYFYARQNLSDGQAQKESIIQTMYHRQDGAIFPATVHVDAGAEPEKHKGQHHEGDLAVEPGYQKSVPVNPHHGESSDQTSQEQAEGYSAQRHMPLPSEHGVLVQMALTRALGAEEKHIRA